MTREETWQRLIELDAVKGGMPTGAWLLSNAKLRDAKLEGADLSNADLFSAHLMGADLSRAKLMHADLGAAVMFGAKLSGADLSDADLRATSLMRADLGGADLSRANLGGAFVFGANLIEAKLMGADLSRANLIEAKLMHVNLSDAFFIDTNLNRADLSNAVITGAMFHGVSTSGWKIEGIKAEYLYFTSDSSNKEKSRRYFPPGKFEELYRSLPTIELIFDQGLSPVELLKLNAIIEELKQQNPDLGLNMSRMSIEQDAARVDIQTSKEENIAAACSVIQAALKTAEEQGIAVNSIMPQIQNLLPFHDAKGALEPFQDRKLEINIYSNCTMHVNKGDGTYTQAFGPMANANFITNNIFHQYEENRETIDSKFDELKAELRESTLSQKEHLTDQTDRLIEELRKGNDVGKAQDLWNEIKEGLKTGGSIATFSSAVVTLMKFFG